MLCESKFRGAIGCWWWAGLLGSSLSYSGPGHWAGSLQERAHPSPPTACWPCGRRRVQGTLLEGSGQWQRATGKGPAPPRTPGRSRGGDLRTAQGPARPAPLQSPGSGCRCSACVLGVDRERNKKLNMAKINKVPTRGTHSRAKEFKNRGRERERKKQAGLGRGQRGRKKTV